MAGGRPRRRRSAAGAAVGQGAGGRRRGQRSAKAQAVGGGCGRSAKAQSVGQGAGGRRRVRFRKKSHFRTPSRPIHLKIRDDTILPGAESQKFLFPHPAVRAPDSYTVIILPKSFPSYTISDLSIPATAAPQMHPEIRSAAELFFVHLTQNVYDSSGGPSAEI